MLERGALRLQFDVSTYWPRIRTLMARYRQMDLADASIVLMSELHTGSEVLTIDRKDFSVYRRNGRQMIDFVALAQALKFAGLGIGPLAYNRRTEES